LGCPNTVDDVLCTQKREEKRSFKRERAKERRGK
jgi:hypothetical protein